MFPVKKFHEKLPDYVFKFYCKISQSLYYTKIDCASLGEYSIWQPLKLESRIHSSQVLEYSVAWDIFWEMLGLIKGSREAIQMKEF